MKKNYETPSVEVVEFRYSDQVVAKSGCDSQWTYNTHPSSETCELIQVDPLN